MAKLYGNSCWKGLEESEINPLSIRLFQDIYGDSVIIIGLDNGEYWHELYPIKDVINRKSIKQSILLANVKHLEFIDQALLICLKSGNYLQFEYLNAQKLEEACKKEDIVMICFENSEKFNKQLKKYNYNISLFLAKQSPLPKRLDFRNSRKRSKRYIPPLFDLPEDQKGKTEKKMHLSSFIQSDQQADKSESGSAGN